MHTLTLFHLESQQTDSMHALQADRPTCWSSAYTMLERLQESRIAVAATLAKLHAEREKCPQDLDELTRKMLVEFIAILEPVKHATDCLQHQRIPTIGTVYIPSSMACWHALIQHNSENNAMLSCNSTDSQFRPQHLWTSSSAEWGITLV